MPSSLPDLSALELFVAIADAGSIGSGARQVGMAQPNASKLMRQLEAAAGTALLQRGPRGSAPTAHGATVRAAAKVLLSATQTFNSTLRADYDPLTEDIRVAASMTVAESLLPRWMAQWRREVPQARVTVEVLNSSEVIAKIKNSEIDLGFVETPQLPVGINATVVAEDELVVIASADHPWSELSGRLSVAELSRTPLIVRERGSGTREALEQMLVGSDPVPPAQVLHSNTAVRTGVASGAGPAVLSQLAVASQLATGEVLQVPLDITVPRRPLTAVWSGARIPVGALAELVEIAAR